MSEPRPTRRELLRAAAVTTGGLVFLGGANPWSRLARAAGSSSAAGDRYFIFCYFAGGWDLLLSLDPRDPALFRYDNRAATRIETGYDLLPAAFQVPARHGDVLLGPYIGELAGLVDRMCIVRGMSMETLTHEAGRRRFITGRPPSGVLARGASADSWLAATSGATELVANLSVGVESYGTGLPSHATALQANSVADLLDALRPGTPDFGDSLGAQVDHLLEQHEACSHSQRSPLLLRSAQTRQKARAMTRQGLDRLFDFAAQTPQMEALRQHYGFQANQLSSAGARAAMAAQAVCSGVSRCVSFVANDRGLDTHFDTWATDQGPSQLAAFNVVARLVEDLRSRPYKNTGESWLDHTLIVGFSEFSRTAMLNVYNGRDHSLTNACFLIGANTRGGTVIGRSSDVGMTPMAIDLETGQLDVEGEPPRPEHIWQAVFESVGIADDAPDLRVDPLRAAFLV